MKRRLRFVACIVIMLILALAGCTTAAVPSPSPTAEILQPTKPIQSATATSSAISELTFTPLATPAAGMSGKVVFVSCKNKTVKQNMALFEVRDADTCEIYVIRADGNNLTNLTNNSVPDQNPSPSPDDTKIAYTSGMGDRSEIFIMNIDGSDQTQITHNTYQDSEPAWSPDGKQLVFVAHHLNRGYEIKTIEADGDNEISLVKGGSSDGNYLSPAWSPLGTQIVFVKEGFNPECQGCSELFLMNTDGSNATQITHNNNWSQNPAWSRDGMKIAYETYRQSGGIGIVLINPDGSGQTELVNTEGWDAHPSWSANGSMIAFQSDRGQSAIAVFDIYIINIDGSGLTRLTTNGNSDSPEWVPNP